MPEDIISDKSDNKLLYEPTLTKSYDAICHHQVMIIGIDDGTASDVTIGM